MKTPKSKKALSILRSRKSTQELVRAVRNLRAEATGKSTVHSESLTISGRKGKFRLTQVPVVSYKGN